MRNGTDPSRPDPDDPAAPGSEDLFELDADPAESAVPSRGLPMGLSIVMVGAACVVVAFGLQYISGIFTPLFFALTLVLTVAPWRAAMVARGIPRVLVSLVMLLFLYAILFGILAGFGVSIGQLIQILPRYATEFNDTYLNTLQWLEGFGVDTSNADLLLSQIDFGRIVAVLQGLLDGLSSAGMIIFIMVMALAFLLFDSTTMDGRLSSLRTYQPYLAAALGDFAFRVRRYWIVNTAFGLIVAVLDVAALMLIGVPLPLVWGLFAWVTNYIPNIGFVIGLVPPALLALLDSGPIAALAVVIAYSTLNFVIQSIIQPKFTGDAVGLNTTVTFMSLVFWTTVVGALGSILAVPLTLFTKSLLIDSSPRLRWLNVFLRSKDADEPPVRPTWLPAYVRSRWPARPDHEGRRPVGATAAPPGPGLPPEGIAEPGHAQGHGSGDGHASELSSDKVPHPDDVFAQDQPRGSGQPARADEAEPASPDPDMPPTHRDPG